MWEKEESKGVVREKEIIGSGERKVKKRMNEERGKGEREETRE